MWNLERIKSLIENKIEENLNLDYKAAGSLEKEEKKMLEISKDVSAFANSEGGVIIYGIKEDKENKHLPAEIDPIDRKTISKEWLEHIIQGRIRPRLNGFEIHPIELNNDPLKVIYIVEIKQSNTAHQAGDQKYYRRSNFNNTPMYDYEIRDIINRTKTPIINLEFIILRHSYEVKQPVIPSLSFNKQLPEIEKKNDYYLKVNARNNGIILANYINCVFNIPERCLVENYYEPHPSAKREFFAKNIVRDVLGMQTDRINPIPKYGPSRYDPLLPKMCMKLQIDSIKLNERYFEPENEIDWIVYADNAEPLEGKIRMRDIKEEMLKINS